MKQITAATIALSLTAFPASADDGMTLMERGAKLFFEGLMDEMDPAFRELEEFAGTIEPALRGFAEEMGPALQDLIESVEDWSAYEPPVVLPNGDILLKRKPATPEPEPIPAPGPGEIDI